GLEGGGGRRLPLVRAHGEARGAADDRRRHDVRDELSRRAEGGAELQRDGPGEGGARGDVPLPRVRARAEGDPRPPDLARAAENPRGVRAEGLRPAAERGGEPRAGGR